MPRRKQSKGTCVYCGKEMAKAGMIKHLAVCTERQAQLDKADHKQGKPETLYHLQVRDAWQGIFWLNLEMRGSASLEDLDSYLRAIWLECCDHLSRFSIGDGWGSNEVPMTQRIERVFAPSVELTHIYDFGTSSKTLVKFAGMRQGKPLTTHPIVLMARNHMPEQQCVECDKPAQWLCMGCLIELNEWTALCDEHREEHEHADYGDPTPLVNSPRLGMCGYSGPAEPPY